MFAFIYSKMNLRKLALAILPLLVAGSEIDSFTFRSQTLSANTSAANDKIDQITNARIEEAVNKLNADSQGHCASLNDLEKTLAEAIGDKYIAGVNAMVGIVEDDVNKGHSPYLKDINGTEVEIPVTRTPSDVHIYNVFDFWKERGFITTNRFIEFVTIKMVDTSQREAVVGSDKLSHFFSTGLEYLNKYREIMKDFEGSTLPQSFVEKYAFEQTLAHGVDTEVGKFGMGKHKGTVGTGVFSFADMSANFAGLQFWTRLTRANSVQNVTGPSIVSFENGTASMAIPPKVMMFHPKDKRSHEPYFECQNGRWVMTKPFQWAEYVSPAWDEGINPNEFKAASMKDKFQARLRDLYEKGVLSQPTLPLDASMCQQLSTIAPTNVLPYILHPDCYALLK